MDISTEVAAIQAASQGSELRQPLIGALNKLNSGSLPAVTASDVGKILKVGANGWEVGEKSGYMPVPTASKQITENGTYDVVNYASAVVNVSGGGGGNNILSGETDPSLSIGNNGDIYIKTKTSTINIAEYLENQRGQWIQLDYIPKSNSIFELDGVFPAPTNSYDTPFGARGGTDVFVAYNGGTYRYIWGSGANVGSITSYYNQLATMLLSRTRCAFIVNGSAVLDSNISGSGTSSTKLGIFTLATGTGSNMSSCDTTFKLHEFRIYEDSYLVHKYIPALDDQNIGGLFDVTTGMFYYGMVQNSPFTTGQVTGSKTIKIALDTFIKKSGTWEQLIGNDIYGYI